MDWNQRDGVGTTPLYWALWNPDNLEIIGKQPNLDYNIKSNDGDTLAQVAVRRADVKLVETLAAQEKFHYWNVPDKAGDTPVLKALKENKMDILQMLLNCPRVDLTLNDDNGDSLIMVALKTGRIDVVKLLLQHPGVDLSTRDGQGASLEKIAR